MNRLVLAIFTVVLFGVCSIAQTQQTQPTDPQAQPATPQTQAPTTDQATAPQNNSKAPQQAAHTKVAPGSVIPAQLTKTVDAKKAKVGDPVEATVTQDMKTNNGTVLLPKDTKIMGKVTEAQARSKEQKESELSIAFDRAVTKDGNTMDMPMSIQAIVGRPNPAQNQEGTGGSPSGNGGGTAGSTPRGMPGGASSSPGMPRSSAPSDAPNGPAGETQSQSPSAQPQITSSTTGVVGISNLTLSPPNSPSGSVVSSEKNNVKLEGGTLLLLKVNQ